ncbi:DUF2062 domain-containing protein [Taibaiella sp. KBW10]|uniref:DUF2062 domain-containing protein n=1 Tax=Taibaiella sp. KBW10 TaxID=2153357 RepID=UPI000F59AA42|nr:DUF2062 domain-containing protein [Taibaiella sp. KBW10]RQO30809.1 DUF2062 domain-containing protein [Taibaiella sp. KBW10]
MEHVHTTDHRFTELGICVLIPTYNNAGTLKQVIEEVLHYTGNVLVVNDGSTDHTAEILAAYPQVEQLSYTPNQGKGNALKLGFRRALALGYTYAITIDSDGQHYPADLPLFVDAIAAQPNRLIIGARNLNQEHVPTKSSFGNKFSNFWFWVETGIRLPDTQSGYRLYPLAQAGTLRYFSGKYELEIEAPVRIAWKGVPVSYIPIQVYYPPAAERISHFRPFKDFTRISILNTFLTFIALLWIHPRNFIKKLFTKEGWKALYQSVLLKPEESNARKASSIGFGVFMGIVPIWGFQLAIGIPLAIFFRLNKGLFILAANISVFPLTPVWWALSLMVGKWVLGYEDWTFKLQDMSLTQFKEAGVAFFLGGTILALVLGAVAYLISLLLFRRFREIRREHH